MNKDSDNNSIPLHEFPIFWGCVVFLTLSIVIFYFLFVGTIPDKFFLPALSIATLLLIFGLILLCSLFFFYSVMLPQFTKHMRIFRGRVDEIVKKIEEDNKSEFEFRRITFTFKFPFMRIETELCRKEDSSTGKKGKK